MVPVCVASSIFKFYQVLKLFFFFLPVKVRRGQRDVGDAELRPPRGGRRRRGPVAGRVPQVPGETRHHVALIRLLKRVTGGRGPNPEPPVIGRPSNQVTPSRPSWRRGRSHSATPPPPPTPLPPVSLCLPLSVLTHSSIY